MVVTKEQTATIQKLAQVVGQLKEKCEQSDNIGLLQGVISKVDGNFCIDIEHAFPIGEDRCTVDWGDVVMVEKCLKVVYTPHDTEHPVRFIFRYFYEEQSLWVFPERMPDSTLQKITDWIMILIAYDPDKR